MLNHPFTQYSIVTKYKKLITLRGYYVIIWYFTLQVKIFIDCLEASNKWIPFIKSL